MKKYFVILIAVVMLSTSNLLGVVKSANAATVTVPEVKYKSIQIGDEEVYQIAPEDVTKFKQYLQSGESELMSTQSTKYWARVAMVIFGAIVNIFLAQTLDAAIITTRQHGGNAGDIDASCKSQNIICTF